VMPLVAATRQVFYFVQVMAPFRRFVKTMPESLLPESVYLCLDR
jgi:hypothetical protein